MWLINIVECFKCAIYSTITCRMRYCLIITSTFSTGNYNLDIAAFMCNKNGIPREIRIQYHRVFIIRPLQKITCKPACPMIVALPFATNDDQYKVDNNRWYLRIIHPDSRCYHSRLYDNVESCVRNCIAYRFSIVLFLEIYDNQIIIAFVERETFW